MFRGCGDRVCWLAASAACMRFSRSSQSLIRRVRRPCLLARSSAFGAVVLCVLCAFVRKRGLRGRRDVL